MLTHLLSSDPESKVISRIRRRPNGRDDERQVFPGLPTVWQNALILMIPGSSTQLAVSTATWMDTVVRRTAT